jgi:uncharacterized protein (DUF488 family)
MFYRRKIILALLEIFGDPMEKIRFQKLLFLLSMIQEIPSFDFVPYRFGCYSFSAAADIKAMAMKGILDENEATVASLDRGDYFRQLKPEDKKLILEIRNDYGLMDAEALMKCTYQQYPFYAINSEVARKLMSQPELEQIEAVRPKKSDVVLYTIGYEGISLEEYLVRLLKNDIRLVIDVRNNPLSMKWGFSKNQLRKHCENIGIQYMHFPELGVVSEQRQGLHTVDNYDKLFDLYRISNLTHTTQSQLEVLKLLKQHKRIALTCFEANIHQCHRMPLSEAISKLPGFTYEVKHI